MKYISLPQTNLQLSQICLGTMTFGGQTSEADSLAIMDYAFEQGVNFFDTANVYNQGGSETIVGKGLKGRRDRIVLATKVRGKMGSDRNSEGLSRRNIVAAVDASLKRLSTDYIDIYYLHAPDYATAIEETLETMSDLVRSGKIRYVGVSNFAAWQIADILAACDKHSYVAPVITQNVYNLLTRSIETELIPCILKHQIGLAIYNPIAGGLLTGKHRPGTPADNTRFANNKTYLDRYWTEENFSAVQELEAIADGCGLSLLQLAMKWCAAQKGMTSIISGVSRLSQIEQNIASLADDVLTDEALQRCDAVWHQLTGSRFQYNR
ncbi:MAG: aldo/keto reductase [Bacillota bacterium]|nr:aldo/keto reductase [Bacillota bacterium]